MPAIRNPILPGFHPDPSLCRVGEDYYIANSTFEWFPGVPIHHSRDLANWQLIGHALTRTSQLDLRGVADSAGVWAPSLSHADGQFWLVYTNIRQTGMGRPFKDIGIFLTTARNVCGPWSEPVELNSIGFDPSLFHDDDGRKWLVNMEWDFRKGRHRFAGIVIQEYDATARKLAGPQTKILEKPNILTEGPNLYKHDGWYYLMLAEGGTGWNHGISMARARDLLGPYELDPQPSVLTSREDAMLMLQKAGHGELVETPAGEWYLAHLASRPIRTKAGKNLASPDKTASAEAHAGHRCMLGRETCLQRVEWRDGWLRLATGETRPQETWPAPKVALGVSSGIPSARNDLAAGSDDGASWHDDFSSEMLDLRWSSLRVPPDESWLSLTERPGWLRLRGRDSMHSLFTQSLIARRVQHFQFTVETCLEFAPTHFTQMAGLIGYYDTRQHFYLRVTHDEKLGKVLGIVLTDDGVYDELLDSQVAINDWKQVFLRARFDCERLQFSASSDGRSWCNIGPVLDASKLSDDYGGTLRFTGAMIGVCAQDVGGTRAVADFDYFYYRPGSEA
ncbi:MAG TPA: glycoside hydrolase family 43 protein [Verrucomicrobiae bacterium]|nr:glycoside hydrolase family 43 protein [Verrucomicrobiae bacterium]